MKGFDQHDHQVGRFETAAIKCCAHLDDALRVAVHHAQAIAVDGVDVRLERVDQRDFGTRCGERSAECASTKKVDFQFVSFGFAPRAARHETNNSWRRPYRLSHGFNSQYLVTT
jgi:hypothetical protein